jgi:site-specific recombinase XerD
LNIRRSGETEPDTARILKRMKTEADGPYVFRSERGGPIDASTVQGICKRAGGMAGLGFRVHPHMLRHAAGFALAEQGTDMRLIQDFLGHKDIKNTVIYTETRFGFADRCSLLRCDW